MCGTLCLKTSHAPFKYSAVRPKHQCHQCPPSCPSAHCLTVPCCRCALPTEQFREYFTKFGTVLEATIMLDHNSNRSRGFG